MKGQKVKAPWLRIEIVADDETPFIAMFEPTGMTYNLAGGERMFVDVEEPTFLQPGSEVPIFRVEPWAGGISFSPPASVVTRDAEGNELHWLN